MKQKSPGQRFAVLFGIIWKVGKVVRGWFSLSKGMRLKLWVKTSVNWGGLLRSLWDRLILGEGIPGVSHADACLTARLLGLRCLRHREDLYARTKCAVESSCASSRGKVGPRSAAVGGHERPVPSSGTCATRILCRRLLRLRLSLRAAYGRLSHSVRLPPFYQQTIC